MFGYSSPEMQNYGGTERSLHRVCVVIYGSQADMKFVSEPPLAHELTNAALTSFAI